MPDTLNTQLDSEMVKNSEVPDEIYQVATVDHLSGKNEVKLNISSSLALSYFFFSYLSR